MSESDDVTGVTKIEVSEGALAPSGREALSYICGKGLEAFADFSCKACGKDLKPDCKDQDCEYVRNAKAFCEKYS